jgi:hypothetical protein
VAKGVWPAEAAAATVAPRASYRSGVLHEPRAYPAHCLAGGTVCRVSLARRCSRTACARPAVATLTYDYADQTAVLGPLATYAEPHAYDLCSFHSERLSAPRGWEVLRLALDQSLPGPTEDDLLALADAVREAARPVAPVQTAVRETGREVARRGHLRMLTND